MLPVIVDTSRAAWSDVFCQTSNEGTDVVKWQGDSGERSSEHALPVVYLQSL